MEAENKRGPRLRKNRSKSECVMLVETQSAESVSIVLSWTDRPRLDPLSLLLSKSLTNEPESSQSRKRWLSVSRFKRLAPKFGRVSHGIADKLSKGRLTSKRVDMSYRITLNDKDRFNRSSYEHSMTFQKKDKKNFNMRVIRNIVDCKFLQMATVNKSLQSSVVCTGTEKSHLHRHKLHPSFFTYIPWHQIFENKERSRSSIEILHFFINPWHIVKLHTFPFPSFSQSIKFHPQQLSSFCERWQVDILTFGSWTM